MNFLSSCGAVSPEKQLYPLAVAFDYASEEATAGGKWRGWYAPAKLAVVTGQGKDEQEE